MNETRCHECDSVLNEEAKVVCHSCYRAVLRDLDDAEDDNASLEQQLKDAEECIHTESDYGILLKEARELELENIELKHKIKELENAAKKQG